MKIKETVKSISFKMGVNSLSRLIEFPIMLKYLNPKMNDKILDVACGNGQLSLKIAKLGCEVHGIDLSPEVINVAKKNSDKEALKCIFKVANAENLPYVDEQFNKVLSNCSLEHFQNDTEALKEMNRVLQKNGVLILSVDSLSYPINEELKEEHRLKYSVVNYYTKESITKKLIDANFYIIESKYIMNSKLSSIFYNYLYMKNENQYLSIFLSIIGYPFCLFSDKIYGLDDKGYGLVLKAKKIN